jgi:hypothetical protein
MEVTSWAGLTVLHRGHHRIRAKSIFVIRIYATK